MYLPVTVPSHSYSLYWDSKTTVYISVTAESSINMLGTTAISFALDDTLSILKAAYGYRFLIQQKQPVALFAPIGEKPLKAS